MSLIELMVAIVIGLIVVGGLTSLVVATISTNNDNMNMTRLTQELRNSMQLITRDLRRAGFSRDALLDVGTGAMANPFITVDYQDLDGDGFDDDNCILYSFDGEPAIASGSSVTTGVDGTASASEQHGVRYDQDNLAIDYIADSDNTLSTCGGTDDWVPMTDKNAVEITSLTFGDVGSTGSFPTVTSSGGSVTVREIQVTISGQLKDDPDFNRTIQDTVRVRNDVFN